MACPRYRKAAITKTRSSANVLEEPLKPRSGFLWLSESEDFVIIACVLLTQYQCATDI